MKENWKQGILRNFTLIELLVVIAIIAMTTDSWLGV